MLTIRTVSELETDICLYFNRLNHNVLLSALFGGVSRLGNGIFWYVLIALQPLFFGFEGLILGIKMLTGGLINLIIYVVLKKTIQRVRPCQYCSVIRVTEPALDAHSFPSGHTLHAVYFTLLLILFDPRWAWLLLPFLGLICLSRLVLGLHYPSDVLVAALIGILVATAMTLI